MSAGRRNEWSSGRDSRDGHCRPEGDGGQIFLLLSFRQQERDVILLDGKQKGEKNNMTRTITHKNILGGITNVIRRVGARY